MSADGRKRAQGGAADPSSWAGAGGDAQGVRRRQLVLFSVIAAAVLIVLAAWLTAGGGKGPAPAGGIDAELAGPDVPEKVWTRRSEARIGAIETRLREMQGEARRLAAENERLRGRLVGDAENARGVIDRQAAAIDELERRLRTDPPPEGAPGDAPYFRTPGASPSGSSRAPGPVAPAPLIETFELEGDAGGAGAGPRSGAEIVAGAVEKSVAAVAAGGRPCRGRGARGRRRLGRGLLPGRSAPGAVPHHRPRLDRGGRRDGARRRHRGLHRDRRRPRRPLVREGLCPVPDHDLRGLAARHRHRDRGGGVRGGLGQDRGARPGGEPRGGAGREGVPRGPRLRRRPGDRGRLPAPGGGDRAGPPRSPTPGSPTSAGPGSAPGRRRPDRRSPTT